MYKDNRSELLRLGRDTDAHERPGALVGRDAHLAASLHRLSKVPRLFDVSGTRRTPRGEILKGACVQLFAYLFFEQTTPQQ